MCFGVVVFVGLAAIAANASAQTSTASGEVIELQREVFGQPSPLYEEFPAAVNAQLALANATRPATESNETSTLRAVSPR
jgi:hypothetical protein